METYARLDGKDDTLVKAGVVRRRPVGAAAVVTVLAALAAGIAAGALLGPQTTAITTGICPAGYWWSSCPPPFYDPLFPEVWTGIAAFFLVLAAAAAIALMGALIERGALPATPDGIGRARLPPVPTAAVVLFVALTAGVAAAVPLGTTRSILLTRSCPVGTPPPPCLPPPPVIVLDPNLWAGLLAFALILTFGTGLAALSRRR